MQFIYIDESGTGEERIAVMVGVIADSHRMRLTKKHWNELLRILSEITERDIKEIHTKDFYPGNSPWRGLNGKQRSDIITAIFHWLVDRKHSIVISAVDKGIYNDSFMEEEFSSDISSLWRMMAFHLALSIQKKFQGTPSGKDRKVNTTGHSVLIFDNEEREQKHFTDLLLNPPDWSDSYYEKKPKQDKLSQIIDVPHFVDSRDVGLIQLADFICFFLRRYIELNLGCINPDYSDEIEKVANWANLILNQLIDKRYIYKCRGRCDCADLFYRYAPDIIK
jgi:hypothetical protein